MWTRRQFLGAAVVAPVGVVLPVGPASARAVPAAPAVEDAAAQLRAAVAEGQRRLGVLEQELPALRAHLVLATLADQAELHTTLPSLVERLSGAFEASPALERVRALLREGEAAARRSARVPGCPPQDDLERRRAAIDVCARDLRLSAALLVEVRFDELRYAVVAAVKQSRLIDRVRTKPGPESIRVVMGSVLDLARAGSGAPGRVPPAGDDIPF